MGPASTYSAANIHCSFDDSDESQNGFAIDINTLLPSLSPSADNSNTSSKKAPLENNSLANDSIIHVSEMVNDSTFSAFQCSLF